MSKLTSDSATNPEPLYPTVPDGKSLLMDPRTALALRQSMEHWGKLADSPRSSGPLDCALCRIFHPTFGDQKVCDGAPTCSECPIRVVAKEEGCRNTPYALYLVSVAHRDMPGVLRNAQYEVSFLAHLLSCAVIRDYAPTGAKLIDTPPEPAIWPEPKPCTTWSPVIKPGLYLHLYHGRETLVEDMDDWGFEGPHIGPLVGGVSMTYGSEINIVLEPEDYQKFFGALSPHFGRQDDAVHHSLRIKEGCVAYNGMYYGDFSVYWR